ncbi:(deoxy)nucleoside triphosphate pyrophosphohydrolase [Bacillus thuringiensis]|nr:(deoxy)nucleoside triphosphate pyrophosphohydrolase [Bacillus thuringiensis]MED2809999.1 (deoxy)nucleoside triphosphate pyrophosphohydrolase [Bacillus thuringiensis]MED2827141.1 (deoxy)nucleoside triphosphate pyrophosphohydrolase [Bacillus thuringiensis]MED2832859.1 (deoxy)nucleoside triphosphate pyrophosphohydrolase [Bacillus thuringiensis]MED2851145.1 (deoxy)nucleoside triphosphate pyrophosphohydrolase [Bacillus thuringiensis]
MKKRVSVVGAVIFNNNNEVLCALRSPKMSLPEYWEFPGGKIEKGETPQGALVREIKEELGCIITIEGKIEEVEHEYENIIVHLATYKACINYGIPEAFEHEKLIWLSVDNLTELEWAPADLPTVKKLQHQL